MTSVFKLQLFINTNHQTLATSHFFIMLKIKLSRQGKRNAPFYRIILIDERKKLTGRALENFGTWQPSNNTKTIDKKLIEEWAKKGAQITPAVKKLLSDKK